jgi:hypothetical protein
VRVLASEDGVTRIRSGWITRLGAAALAALAAGPPAARAETDAMLATLDKPATVTVQRAPPAAETAAASRRPRVVISVTNYSPTADCTPVQAVVKARTDGGPEVEVGRFAITPDQAFDAAAPEAQRFALPLPAGFATDKPVRVTVALVPVEGAGPNSACPANLPEGARRAGASLRIGTVEIQ